MVLIGDMQMLGWRQMEGMWQSRKEGVEGPGQKGTSPQGDSYVCFSPAALDLVA